MVSVLPPLHLTWNFCITERCKRKILSFFDENNRWCIVFFLQMHLSCSDLPCSAFLTPPCPALPCPAMPYLGRFVLSSSIFPVLLCPAPPFSPCPALPCPVMRDLARFVFSSSILPCSALCCSFHLCYTQNFFLCSVHTKQVGKEVSICH